MNTRSRSAGRWPLLAGYLGLVILMLACMGVAVGTSDIESGTLHLDNGVVEISDENGDWVPVAGDSTFELVGALESMDPWTAAGTTFETNESTQIEEELQTGNLVRVRGMILEDGTWLALSIELAEEQTDPIIILIGTADSVAPWVVNGITLNVTGDTVITGTITPGMIVRVEILLLADGTWEVISIAPLGEFTEISDCATVIATVVSVNGNEVQLVGWPIALTLGEDVEIEGGDGRLSPDQVILLVACPSEDNLIVIVQIIILGDIDDDGTTDEGGEKVLVCHKPDKKGGHTLSIASAAVPAHLGHGDTLGACP